LYHFNLTSNERIASVSWRTATDRIVVDDLTFGVYSTCSRTRIATFLVATSLILRTFIVCGTFRSTSRRSSYVSWHTRTYGLAIDLAALRVGSTR
jgi:hypothetical protein